ncbi:MAG: GNAT family N-acetyltransferase [Burkholderiaceae bacterium]
MGAAYERQQIWVDEARRRRGIGAALMRKVEEIALERGCRLLYLDTFSLGAGVLLPAGYETACRLDGFPDGGSKFMRKSLIS